MIDKFKKLNKKQKIIYISLISILLICLVLLCSIPISKVIQNNKIKNLIQQGKLKEISYKVSKVYENGLNADVVVTIASEQEIDCVIYKNSNNEDVVIYANNRNVVAIDYKMVDKNSYSFDANYKDGTSKTLTIDFEIPRIKGNYTLNNGIYVNEPEISIGFSKEKTRYMYLNENNNLVPGNWINGQKPENWYNYKEQNWANIYSESDGIDSYYVWIPRYCYKIDTTNSVAGNERMDVKFINTYNEYIDGETNQKTSWEELKKQGYQIPEAFKWGAQDTEYIVSNQLVDVIIPGYWITKYQLSELTSYIVDYASVVNMGNIEVSNVTVKSNETVPRYAYALNGIIEEEEPLSTSHIFKNVGEGAKVINVTALNANGEIIGSYTQDLVLEEPDRPDTRSFDQSTTFYVWWDEAGNEHNETPLNKPAPENWYKYSSGRWANIVSRNNGEETYYIWIPRYEYKLNSIKQRSEIRFVGIDVNKLNKNISTGYQIPEAFWWDNNGNGIEEEGEQLSGYWITKYQLSEASNHNRIDANLLAGSRLIRVKEITGSLINEAKSNNINMKFEYYLDGELMQDAIGEAENENYVFKNLNENTTYTINIILRNKDTNEFIGAVTKKIKTITPCEPNVEKFNKDVTYYVWYDNEGNEQRTPLTENPPSNWYDYSNNMWANIVTTNGGTETYFVWIPRYEYKLDGTVYPQKSIINFIGTNITKANNNISPGYQIPEAFWWDNNGNGTEEEGEQLSGYWITKYQLNG